MDAIIARHIKKTPEPRPGSGAQDTIVNVEDAADFSQVPRRVSSDFATDGTMPQDTQVPDQVQMVSTTYTFSSQNADGGTK